MSIEDKRTIIAGLCAAITRLYRLIKTMPYSPINSMEKVFSHPQTLERNMVETVEQRASVHGKIKVLRKYLRQASKFRMLTCAGMPVKFSESQPSIRGGPPGLGEHIDEVLQEIDLSREAIADLRREEVC